MKEFDSAGLAKYNGEKGSPTYIAHNGKVYDVSQSKLWGKGLHMNRHHAGQDLSDDIQAAPHEPDVLERYPQVGVLKQAPEARQLPMGLAWLLERAPILRRHPHPTAVHFPIVFMLSTTGFNLLYLLTGIRSFETTAFHCLGAGILFTFLAVFTGLYTWWLNYMSKMLRPVNIKIQLSLIMLTTAMIVFLWRMAEPNVLDAVQGINILYLVLVLSLSVMVAVIGWFGASMTFPIEKP
jgi:predicted heme/steroid binding protein/uncharacterized membrane protein